MANLVQVAEELEYVPKDQLIQMSQNPESRYPQYLVLSEIQRRTQMEKRYNAEEASMNRPQTTVAEEVVADFAQPQGLAGMNAEGAANAGAFPPEAMPETPMQMAAGGGRTGYRGGGASYMSIPETDINPVTGAVITSGNSDRSRREALLYTLGIDPTGKTEEQINEEMRFAQGNSEGSASSALGRAVVQAESGGNPNAVSSAGATGLWQLMPETLEYPGYGVLAAKDDSVQENARVGSSYLDAMINKYDGNTEHALAAYNWGPGNTDDWIADGADPNALPAETRNYIPRVLGLKQAEEDSVSSNKSRILGLQQADGWDSAGRIGAESRFGVLPKAGSAGTIDPADIPEEDRNSLIDWAKENPAEAVLIGLDAIALGLLVTPIPGARIAAGVTKALAWAGRGLKGIKTAHQARKAKRIMEAGRRELSRTGRTPGASGSRAPGRHGPHQQTGSGRTRPYNPNLVYEAGAPIVRQMTRQRMIAGAIAAPITYMLYNHMTDDEVADSKEQEQGIVESTQDKLDGILAGLNKEEGTGTTEKKGLSSFLPQAEGLDIAQLGGVIMGARNMSELGAGIAGLAGSMQDRRTKEKLTEIQGNLYEAQTAKYRADIESMESNQLVELLTSLGKQMKLELENGNTEDAANIRNQYNVVLDRYYSVEGIERPLSEEERMRQALESQRR